VYVLRDLLEAGAKKVPKLLSRSEVSAVQRLTRNTTERAGDRTLLSNPWCAALAKRLQTRLPLLATIAAVQCTLFEKCAAKNWLVAAHQDLNVPTTNDDAIGRSTSDGVRVKRANEAFLNSCIAVRVHLDECGESDGSIRFIPRSHHHGVVPHKEIAIHVVGSQMEPQIASAGDAWLMSPLIIHASSKASGSSKRRVLHFLFAPAAVHA
jgi:Phytanoyl-CoA dioxygenase (PhyH)